MFYQLYPRYRERDLFITGESYSGRWIPAIARLVVESNRMSSTSSPIRLNGIAIGGAWVHPPAQITTYTQYAHALGLIDFKQKESADRGMAIVLDLIAQGMTRAASDLWDSIAAEIYLAGGDFSTFDVRDYSGTDDDPGMYSVWLNDTSVRHALFVGDRHWGNGDAVFNAFAGDEMRSSLEDLESVMGIVRVLLFNGDMDFIVNSIGVTAMLDHPGRDEFVEADRVPMKMGGNNIGLVRSVPNLTHVLIFNAGHMVPTDQPEAAFAMVRNLKHGKH